MVVDEPSDPPWADLLRECVTSAPGGLTDADWAVVGPSFATCAGALTVGGVVTSVPSSSSSGRVVPEAAAGPWPGTPPPTRTKLPPRASPARAQPADARPFKCPFDSCLGHQGWSSKSALAGHLNSIHVRARMCPPPEFLGSMGMWVCRACWTLNVGRSGCKGDRCASLEPGERAAQAARGMAAAAQTPLPLADPPDTAVSSPLWGPEPPAGHPHEPATPPAPRPKGGPHRMGRDTGHARKRFGLGSVLGGALGTLPLPPLVPARPHEGRQGAPP